MPRQLYDGLIDYEDGTPASAPQMANDVALTFLNDILNIACIMHTNPD